MSSPSCDNIPSLIPYLTVRDVQETLDYYQKTFQFELFDKPMEEDGKLVHAEMKCEESIVMMGREGAFGMTSEAPTTSGVESPVSLYLYVKDVDKFYQHAKEAGAEITLDIQDAFWGDRMFAVNDINGHRFSFASPLKKS